MCREIPSLLSSFIIPWQPYINVGAAEHNHIDHVKDLGEMVRCRLEKMIATNPNRVDYYERYQEIIHACNKEQDRATIEKTFLDLMDLAGTMTDEERRYVREGFESDEQLILYDLLFREDLSKQDIQKIKKVSVNPLTKIKAKIKELDHWTDKQEAQAAVGNLIRDTLWAELPASYDVESIGVYRKKIFDYV